MDLLVTELMKKYDKLGIYIVFEKTIEIKEGTQFSFGDFDEEQPIPNYIHVISIKPIFVTQYENEAEKYIMNTYLNKIKYCIREGLGYHRFIKDIITKYNLDNHTWNMTKDMAMDLIANCKQFKEFGLGQYHIEHHDFFTGTQENLITDIIIT
jgi:hypothetical protein